MTISLELPASAMLLMLSLPIVIIGVFLILFTFGLVRLLPFGYLVQGAIACLILPTVFERTPSKVS